MPALKFSLFSISRVLNSVDYIYNNVMVNVLGVCSKTKNQMLEFIQDKVIIINTDPIHKYKMLKL